MYHSSTVRNSLRTLRRSLTSSSWRTNCLLRSAGRRLSHSNQISRTQWRPKVSKERQSCRVRPSMQQTLNDRYMLDSIGAGATAKTKQDWGKVWANSDECKRVTEEIQKISTERKNAEISKFMKDQREYAMPMSTQIMAVTKRSFTSYWRDPDYLLGK